MAPHRYILSLGSNCTDRTKAVGDAITFLSSHLDTWHASHIYDSPAVDKSGLKAATTEAPTYANAVMTGVSELSPAEFDLLLKRYERANGRDDEARARRSVPIDIDIVVCDDEILRPWDYAQNFFRIGQSALNVPLHEDEEEADTALSALQDSRTE